MAAKMHGIAGGRLKARGDFGGGQPFAFVEDPDGYEIELCNEDTPPHERFES